MATKKYMKTSISLSSTDKKNLQALAAYKQTTVSELIRILIKQGYTAEFSALASSESSLGVSVMSKSSFAEKYYTSVEVAARLNVSKAAVIAWVAENKIRSVKVKVPGTPGSLGFRYGFPKEYINKLKRNRPSYDFTDHMKRYHQAKYQELRDAGYLSVRDIEKDCGWSHRHILNMINRQEIPMHKLSERGRRGFRYVISAPDYAKWKKQHFLSHPVSIEDRLLKVVPSSETADENKIQTLELDVDDFNYVNSCSEDNTDAYDKLEEFLEVNF